MSTTQDGAGNVKAELSSEDHRMLIQILKYNAMIHSVNTQMNKSCDHLIKLLTPKENK